VASRVPVWLGMSDIPAVIYQSNYRQSNYRQSNYRNPITANPITANPITVNPITQFLNYPTTQSTYANVLICICGTRLV
jgi:hypothetical protein